MRKLAYTFTATVLTTGCSLSAQESVEKLLEELSSSGEDSNGETDSTEETDSTTTSGPGQPSPTTGGWMTAAPETTGDPPDSDTQPVGDEIEIIEFESSTYGMNRAGTVIFSAEIAGPVERMALRVHRPGQEQPENVPWPVGDPTLEYIINGDKFDGNTTFELVAWSENEDKATASLDISIDLPPPGTLDGRWTLESSLSTEGTALAIRPGKGTEPDTVIAVGNANDRPILVELVDGQLVKTYLGNSNDFVFPNAIAVDGDAMYLAGASLFGEMVLRRYDLATNTELWRGTYEDARAFDVGVGPDGQIVAVGEVEIEGDSRTWAAVWAVSNSGGGDWTPITLPRYTTGDEALGSGLHGLAIVDGRVISAGFAEQEVEFQRRSRASVFEVVNGEIEIRHVQGAVFKTEVSGWNSIALTHEGLQLTGWQKDHIDLDPLLATIGRFGTDLKPLHFSLGWPGVGNGTAGTTYQVAAGSRTVGGFPRFFVQAPLWLDAYTDPAGDLSAANSVAVDRHGFAYVLGFYEDGSRRLVLSRFSP